MHTGMLYMFQDDVTLFETLHFQRLMFGKIHICKIHGDKKDRC